VCSMSMSLFYTACHILIIDRRGCAAFIGRDVNKLKAKGGGKFKYMSENDMLELAEKFRPYRYVALVSERSWTVHKLMTLI
jgi:hypothetical protein